MSDFSVSPLSVEEARVRNAADQACRVLQGDNDPTLHASARLVNVLAACTRQPPLQALATAVFLGIFIARQR